jgi:hypothetical protein
VRDPQAVLEEVERLTDERRERVDLAGRSLPVWSGKDISADTAALADTIVTSGAKLYRTDKILVRVVAPASDPATAERVRKMHGYQGPPEGADDPAIHAGERVMPILPSDTEALRAIIAEHVATKRHVKGTEANAAGHYEITSFAFKPSAKTHEEPDAGVLKDLLKWKLPRRVPEIMGVITAPVMPDLPASTKPDELLKLGTDCIITSHGFDPESCLFLSPLGGLVEVPDRSSYPQVRAATELLRKPWTDFPFVSPGPDIEPEVSRSVAIYGTMIAANRRALDIAPGSPSAVTALACRTARHWPLQDEGRSPSETCGIPRRRSCPTRKHVRSVRLSSHEVGDAPPTAASVSPDLAEIQWDYLTAD